MGTTLAISPASLVKSKHRQDCWLWEQPAVAQRATELRAKQPAATGAELLGSQLLLQALAVPGRKLGAMNYNELWQKHWLRTARGELGKGICAGQLRSGTLEVSCRRARSRNRSRLQALALEASCHREILMQENNAVMLNFCHLASLILKHNNKSLQHVP